MEAINKQKLQPLADFHGVNCVSIYIPTHRKGKEVNEGQDAILLKNHYQKIKRHLEQKDMTENEAAKYLQPIRQLIDNKDFWRHQESGLAVFLGQDFFEYHHLPYSTREFSLLSTSFHLEQLLPWFNGEDTFYILALSLKKVRLLVANEYEIRELDIEKLVPENIDVVLSYYEFEQEQQSPSQWQGGGGSPTYPDQKREKGFDKVYMEEYFRHINEGLDKIMVFKQLPVVLAAVDYLHPIYHKTNKTLNLQDEGIKGNPDQMQPQELLEKALEIMRPHLDKRKLDHMETYRSLAGTEKTAHDIHQIAPAAIDGRIEALFIVRGTHHWGTVNLEDHSVQLRDEPHENDQCLVSKSAVQTILHGGSTYLVAQDLLPEDIADARLAAVFRW